MSLITFVQSNELVLAYFRLYSFQNVLLEVTAH